MHRFFIVFQYFSFTHLFLELHTSIRTGHYVKIFTRERVYDATFELLT